MLSGVVKTLFHERLLINVFTPFSLYLQLSISQSKLNTMQAIEIETGDVMLPNAKKLENIYVFKFFFTFGNITSPVSISIACIVFSFDWEIDSLLVYTNK